MSETTINFIVNAAVYASMGLGFVLLTNHTFKWYYKQMIRKIVENDSAAYSEYMRHLQKLQLELEVKISNYTVEILDEFANLEEKIVMIHQDILYFDQDLGNLEARVIRLEHQPRPTISGPGMPNGQGIPSYNASPEQATINIDMPLRRMRELRRRNRR